jgi:HK97 gp10 family phage protein
MALTVEVEGLDKLIKDVDKAGGNARPLMKAAIVNSVNKIQSNVRSRAPHRTGTLQRSVLTQVDYPDGMVTVSEKYGEYIEKGTGIYGPTGSRITPKNAKALSFTVGGQRVFAKSVKGMKARPFFAPAVEESAQYITAQFVKVIDIITNGLAGRGF